MNEKTLATSSSLQLAMSVRHVLLTTDEVAGAGAETLEAIEPVRAPAEYDG